MGLRLTTALGAGAALVCAAVAAAQVQDRFLVASDPDSSGYPRALAVVIESPPEYVRDFIGRGGNDAAWTGPRYQATGLASLGGDSSLDWSIEVEKKPSTRQTIIDNLVHDWAPVAEGAEAIEHTIAGRAVGTFQGTWVLTQGTPMAGEARYEAGLVFPLCGRNVRLHISALTPASDSAGGSMGFGEYRIQGMKPTEWNRAKVLETIRGVSVDGGLPAARIRLRAAGRVIRGSAADCNARPAAGVLAQLERRSGKRWKRVTGFRLTALGTFSTRIRWGSGTYRVVSGGKASNTVRVR
jgi:hypothetical protein